MKNVNIPAKSTHRQRQAQATRDMIVAAAQALFLEQGYICTTIDVIAERAGVAVSTVYAIFGRNGLVQALYRDAGSDEASVNIVKKVLGSMQVAPEVMSLAWKREKSAKLSTVEGRESGPGGAVMVRYSTSPASTGEPSRTCRSCPLYPPRHSGN